MKRMQLQQGLAAAIGMGILILDSRTALSGAREGIDLCLRSLIPSLFPFFVLSSLLTGSLTGSAVPLLSPLGKYLRIPQGCETLLIPAFLGGYPAGAQCIGQARTQGSLSKKSAERLLLFCNNAGPSFLFGVLSQVFPSKGMLWALWALQITGAFIAAWIFPGQQETGKLAAPAAVSVTDSLTGAVRIMGHVCGWVVIFRVMIAFLEHWVLWLFPNWLRIFLVGLLEISNGCCALVLVEDLRLRFLLCSGMLSFGGLCVAMQTASVTDSLPLLPYLGSKILQSFLCLILAAAFLYRMPLLLILVVLTCCLVKKRVALRGIMVYNVAINRRRTPYAVSKKN